MGGPGVPQATGRVLLPGCALMWSRAEEPGSWALPGVLGSPGSADPAPPARPWPSGLLLVGSVLCLEAEGRHPWLMPPGSASEAQAPAAARLWGSGGWASLLAPCPLGPLTFGVPLARDGRLRHTHE